MSEQFVVAVKGLSDLSFVDDIPENIAKAARIAVNEAADKSSAQAKRMMREQVVFAKRYLDDKFGVAKRATGATLEAVVKGTDRPTSLARFVKGTRESTRKDGGATIEIKPGGARFMKKAFVFNLRAGTTLNDSTFNRGLAIRTKDGASPANAWKPKEIAPGLFLLYGPSVDQIFRQLLKKDAVQADAIAAFEAEFDRQMERLK